MKIDEYPYSRTIYYVVTIAVPLDTLAKLLFSESLQTDDDQPRKRHPPPHC